ncbi:hypothetical protein C6341_g11219 [Phytophthora cactorum]|nr:hypothetical protein C6341_g11219 [Phytophthora cactorum]
MDLITQAFTTDALKATMSRRRLRTSPGPLGDPSKTNDPGLQGVQRSSWKGETRNNNKWYFEACSEGHVCDEAQLDETLSDLVN